MYYACLTKLCDLFIFIVSYYVKLITLVIFLFWNQLSADQLMIIDILKRLNKDWFVLASKIILFKRVRTSEDNV